MSMTQPARRKIVSSRSSVKRYLHVGGSDDEGSSNISINNQDDQQDAKPFPWLPMSALSSTLIAHTATLASFYTYIGVFVQNIMGLETVNSAGYYAGWLASAFTFGRLTTSYMWGLVADRIGRKPVIVIGMLSIVVCSIGFGLSTNFATALMWRFLLGFFNGVWSVVRIVIPEIVGPDRVVISMACMPASKAIGTIIGPAIGGLLGQPADLYPRTFSQTGLFARYPFLLPNLALAALAIVSVPFVMYTLPETMVRSDARVQHDANDKRTVRMDDDTNINALGYSSSSTGTSAATDYSSPTGPAGGVIASAVAPMNTGVRGLGCLPLDSKWQQQQQEKQRTERTVNSSVSNTASLLFNRSHDGDNDDEGSDVDHTASINNRDDDDDSNDIDGDKSKRERLCSSFCYPREQTPYSSPILTSPPPTSAAAFHGCCCTTRGCVSSSNRGFCRCSPVSPSRQGGRGVVSRYWDSVSSAGSSRGRAGDEWLGPRGLLAPWAVRVILIMEGIIAVMNIAFSECLPLWAQMTRDAGGLLWTTKKIGQVLLWTGVGLMLYQFVGYPYLCRKIGIVKLLHVSGVITCVLLAVMPDTLRIEWSDGGSYFVALVIFIAIDVGSSVWNIALSLAATNAVPVHKRGEFMGFFTVVETLGRAVGPAAFGSALAWSVEDHRGNTGGWPHVWGNLVDFHLVFVVQALCMLAVVVLGWSTLTPERLTVRLEDRCRRNDPDGGNVGERGDDVSPAYSPVVCT